MKKTMMMLSSLGLLVLGGMLLIADSAEPELDCKGTNSFDAQYLFELSCKHDGGNFTHQGITHIKLASTDNMAMTSDVEEINFIPTHINYHDRSCEDRADKKSYIQLLFYNLKLDDKAQGIKTDLECEAFELMHLDKLISEEQIGNCVPTHNSDKANPPALSCKIKLLPK